MRVRNRIVGITLLVFVGFLWQCQEKSKRTQKSLDHLDQRTKIRLTQYLREGKQLYQLHCSNCHQVDGSGLARLYPPLKNSDYLRTNMREVICGIRNGQQGELTINGITFDQPMPGIPTLTDLEIAEISTYVYNEFADTVMIVTLNQIRDFYLDCGKDPV